jgi:hypothetical protein
VAPPSIPLAPSRDVRASQELAYLEPQAPDRVPFWSRGWAGDAAAVQPRRRVDPAGESGRLGGPRQGTSKGQLACRPTTHSGWRRS